MICPPHIMIYILLIYLCINIYKRSRKKHPIKTLFDNNTLQEWQIVLGKSMHYHWGFDTVSGNHSQDKAVMRFSKFIPKNSSVLDCGCGFGSVAKLLQKKFNCTVEGITLSDIQAQYIRDQKIMDVHTMDVHDISKIKHKHNIAVFFESITHMNHPIHIINNIGKSIQTIIIKDFTCEIPGFNSQWHMYFRSKQNWYDIFKNTDFKIIHYNTFQHFRYAHIWLKNINTISKPTSQILLLKELCLFLTSKSYNNIFNCEIVAIRK